MLRKFTLGKTGANLAIRLLEESSCILLHELVGLNVFLSLKKSIRPAPPDPSVCVTPIHNVYKSHPI